MAEITKHIFSDYMLLELDATIESCLIKHRAQKREFYFQPFEQQISIKGITGTWDFLFDSFDKKVL